VPVRNLLLATGQGKIIGHGDGSQVGANTRAAMGQEGSGVSDEAVGVLHGREMPAICIFGPVQHDLHRVDQARVGSSTLKGNHPLGVTVCAPHPWL
jgi:hypothetical protein